MGCIIDYLFGGGGGNNPDDPPNPDDDEKDPDENSFKLLLLGAGGSGKSTVFRQVKILYGDGYDNDERLTLAVTIHQNMVQSIKKIIDESSKYGPINKPDLVTQVQQLPDDGPFKDVEKIGALIKEIWAEEGIKATYAKKSNYQLPTDTIDYFFNRAKDVMKDDYMPSQDDLLHCRIHSTGVKTETFTMGDNLSFRLLDVGGQRSERKKWVRCFENVTAVLYVVAISEYDQLCYEDNETNRVVEALELFEDIANSEWFADIDIILFLNKKDLLKKKIASVPPQTFFPEFKGDGSYESVLTYLKNEFDERNQQEREVITHVTCATDTADIKGVFEDKVKKILLNKQGNAQGNAKLM